MAAQGLVCPLWKDMWPLLEEKIILHITRKKVVSFVIFSEFVLDNGKDTWYIIQARVGGICGFFQKEKARDAMMQEIASIGR